MLNEKTMVADALAGVNGELTRFGEMIPQTENKELKQCLKQMRNACEMSQERLYDLARERSYYVPAARASQQEIEHVRSILTQPSVGCHSPRRASGRRPLFARRLHNRGLLLRRTHLFHVCRVPHSLLKRS